MTQRITQGQPEPGYSRNTTSVRTFRNGLVCLAIIANALCAGGVYSFPLISPALAAHMKFSQPQLTTIALAGMVGQYPFAAIVGKILDRHGPRICSLIACISFSLGFGLFSWEIAHTPMDTSEPSSASFRKLTLYFAMIGLGTVFSYFSIVFAATKTFPQYMGAASGTSMALFGSSPLFLSMIASKHFTHSETGLDVTRFLGFMCILSSTAHLLGALCLPGPSTVTATSIISDPDDGTSSIARHDSEASLPRPTEGGVDNRSEREPLLARSTSTAEGNTIPVHEPQHGTIVELLKDPYFWVLTFVSMIIIGGCEMVMANLGSIYTSLPSSDLSAPDDVSRQVQLLSLSNTASRLVIGPLADWISPVAAYINGGIWSFPRKQQITRMVFLTGASILLIATFGWLNVAVRSREALWPLCVGVGVAYGTTFTILPSILSSIWGLPNLGRNFGVLSYSPFVGTTLFSYLYAFISEEYTLPGSSVCRGTRCWRLTFAVCMSALIVSIVSSVILWRQWRGRV